MQEKRVFTIRQLNSEEVILHVEDFLIFGDRHILLESNQLQFLNSEIGLGMLKNEMGDADPNILRAIKVAWGLE